MFKQIFDRILNMTVSSTKGGVLSKYAIIGAVLGAVVCVSSPFALDILLRRYFDIAVKYFHLGSTGVLL